MSARTINPVTVETRSLAPIEIIARAELVRAGRPREAAAADILPDLVPPSDLDRPQGLSAILDTALGQVDLPTLFELQSALAAAGARLAADAAAEGPMGALDSVVAAVLAEEQDKIARYIGVRDA